MQSPPIELGLDFLHVGVRNLIRNAGPADNDTISECCRAGVKWLEEHGLPGRQMFAWGVRAAAELFIRHINNPLDTQE